jgi:hypothetical protein
MTTVDPSPTLAHNSPRSTRLAAHVLECVVASRRSVFAVINAGRDHDFSSRAHARGARCVTLLPDDLAPGMARHGPFLLEVDGDGGLANELIESDWGDGALTLVWSSCDLEQLQLHLQRFVRIRTPAGRRVVFRFYDPLTFVSYLPAFSKAQHQLLFSLVDRVLVEVGHAMALDLSMGAAAQIQRGVIQSHGAEITRYDDILAPVDIDRSGSCTEPEVAFSAEQMEWPVLANPLMLADQLEAYLEPEHGSRMAFYPRGFLQAMLAHGGMLATLAYGIHRLDDICLFVDLQWRIAPGFHLQPDINEVLRNLKVPAWERFERLVVPRYNQAWIEATRLDDASHWFAEVARR